MTRTALVTGAGRGIGRGIALRLAQAGFDVGLTARSRDQLADTAHEVASAGVRAVVAPGDATQYADVERVVKTVVAELGDPDVLVNNAGFAGTACRFVDADLDEWWQVVTTNVLGCVNYTKAVLPAMTARGSGYIVNLNSMQGSKVSGASIAYGVSKAALLRFTNALADEVAGSGVTVVDLSPGLVRTTMTANRPDLDALPPEAWSPPELSGDYVVALASGRYDALHGRIVRVTDDLDDLVRRVEGDPDARVLRVKQPASA